MYLSRMSWTGLREELLVLDSVFCGDGELALDPECALTSDHPSYPVALTVKLTVPCHAESSPVITVIIELILMEFYPTRPPAIRLSSGDVVEAWLSQQQKAVETFASSSVPEPALLDIVTYVREAVQDGIAASDAVSILINHSPLAQSHLNHRDQAEEGSKISQTASSISLSTSPHTPLSSKTSSSFSSSSPVSCTHACLVRLDHMRNETLYIGHLRKWTNELSVFCQIVNAGPHRVYVLLKGSMEDIREFLKIWKSQPVDIDKRGRPCKEKLMTILYQGVAKQPSKQ